jgi:hypothetical protein
MEPSPEGKDDSSDVCGSDLFLLGWLGISSRLNLLGLIAPVVELDRLCSRKTIVFCEVVGQ